MKEHKRKTKVYRFNSVIFSPDDVEPIKYDGKTWRMPPLLVKLLIYFVENPGKRLKKDDIQKAVWGPGEHSHGSLSRAIYALHDVLPPDSKITTINRYGYAFEHKVVCEGPKFEYFEYHLKNTPEFKKYLNIFMSLFCAVFVTITSYAFTHSYNERNPAPSYRLINIWSPFTRDHVVGTPQLSPDERFIFHRLTRNRLVDDYIGIQDEKTGDSRRLVNLGFRDGYKVNLTGDKIVYQSRVTGQCEVRLLTFLNEDKTQFSDELLTDCYKSSGSLSFAWFNDHEFYVNFTGKEAITTPNGLPLHHLYSFNIDSKRSTTIIKTSYQGGVGFYSLEFDNRTKVLYLLKTNFSTTDFYRYREGELIKIQTVDHLVSHFTIDDNRLVYLNHNQDFVINSPADDFSKQQILLMPKVNPPSRPYLQGNRLIYMSGIAFQFTLHQWQNNQLTEVYTQDFNPNVLASYDDRLVFSSSQTGRHRVYMLNTDNEITLIGSMKKGDYIVDIRVANDVFVISLDNRVDIYRYANKQLELVRSLANYQQGVINPSGDKLLLTTTNANGESMVIEKWLDDLTDTGRDLDGALWAFYYHDNIAYLNHDNELIVVKNNVKYVVAVGVKPQSLAYMSIKDNGFYYITRVNKQSVMNKINLDTGNRTTTILNGIKATRVQLVDDKLYIRSRKALKPKLLIGEIVVD